MGLEFSTYVDNILKSKQTLLLMNLKNDTVDVFVLILSNKDGNPSVRLKH